jgi:hypothetical protein
MKHSRSLAKLQGSLERRIERLEWAISLSGGGNAATDKIVSYVTIEALTAWANFAREFYLSCSWLNAKTSGGVIVQPAVQTFTSERDALLYAISLLKPQFYPSAAASLNINSRHEPTWHEASTLTRLSYGLGFNNNSQIIDAFSIQTRFFSDLPTIRNFFAHRNQRTAEKVLSLASRHPYGLTISSPYQFRMSLVPGKPDTILNDWLVDIRLVSQYLCS